MKTDSMGRIIQESPDVLYRGQWVRSGLVWSWVADVEPETQPEPELAPSNVRTLRAVDLIACPLCKALLPECCRSRSGARAASPHRQRLVARTCACGGPLRRPKDHRCDECRSEPDMVVVEHILAGEWRMKAGPAERREVIRQWIADGGTQNELERLTGWNVSRLLRSAA